MRLAGFQHGTVVHYSRCQVGQVFLAEKRQRYASELFCQTHSSYPRLDISHQERPVVLQPREDQYQRDTDDAPCCIERYAPVFQTALHHILYHEIKQPHREHERNILQRTEYAALYRIDRTSSGKCESSLQFLYHRATPPLQLSTVPNSCSHPTSG